MSKKRSPYSIIKHRHLTEKAGVLQNLQHANSNRSVKKCNTPKYVFVVDMRANKQEIAEAVEEIYQHKKVKVTAVNTVILKPKTRRVRGFVGRTSFIKKAIVSLSPGDTIDEQV